MTEVQAECIRKIAEAKGISPQDIGLETTLESIAVDSLDRVSLAFDLEEEYGVEIPEGRLHTIRTVGDVANAVSDALTAKGGAAGDRGAGAA